MEKAIRYAEQNGICEFHLEDGKMIYFSSFPMEKATYRCEVNLETMTETRAKMPKYYKAYKDRIDGKYQSNYMA